MAPITEFRDICKENLTPTVGVRSEYPRNDQSILRIVDGGLRSVLGGCLLHLAFAQGRLLAGRVRRIQAKSGAIRSGEHGGLLDFGDYDAMHNGIVRFNPV